MSGKDVSRGEKEKGTKTKKKRMKNNKTLFCPAALSVSSVFALIPHQSLCIAIPNNINSKTNLRM
jgi:hypothetical protein